MSFAGKKVLITGGTRGIGRSLVEAFIRVEADVAFCSRSADEVRMAELECGTTASRRVLGFRADVSRESDVESLFSTLDENFGTLDVLVNNAGIARYGTLETTSVSEFDETYAGNVRSVFLCSRAYVRRCRDESKAGAIVNIASQAGKRPYQYVGAYCASKAAVIQLTRVLAIEAAPLVRVNAVCPGIVRTRMMEAEGAWRAEYLGADPEQDLRAWAEETPSGRLLEAEDLVSSVMFLASDDSRHTIGEALNVSGGLVMD